MNLKWIGQLARMPMLEVVKKNKTDIQDIKV